MILSNRITGVIAPKGSGKTFEVCRRIRTFERTAVFDMMHEAGYLTACDEVIAGNPLFFWEYMKQEKFRAVYRPVVFHTEDGEEECPEFDLFVKSCYLRGQLTMVIDEAHQLCTPHRCPPALLSAIRLGRHRQVSLIYVTQSWSAVARPLTACTDEFVFFRIIEPRDIEGIRQRCGADAAEKAKTLRRLEFKNGNVIAGEKLVWTVERGIEK